MGNIIGLTGTKLSLGASLNEIGSSFEICNESDEPIFINNFEGLEETHDIEFVSERVVVAIARNKKIINQT